jgi:glycogen(starch) synthase
MAGVSGGLIAAHQPGWELPETAGLAGLRVLRLCSVFEPATLPPGAARYDVIGGMQNHTAELTRQLDRLGVHQVVLTSGLALPVGRQGWALGAARRALAGARRVPGSRFGLVHAHCGEDVGVLPLAWLAAQRHGCPLVVTVHTSVRHTLRVTSPRRALLWLAGGLAESLVLPWADAVIALTRPGAAALGAAGLPAARIRVIPPGYDPGLFAAPGPDPFPHLPRPRVGYLGRLSPQRTRAPWSRRSSGCGCQPAC